MDELAPPPLELEVVQGVVQVAEHAPLLRVRQRGTERLALSIHVGIKDTQDLVLALLERDFLDLQKLADPSWFAPLELSLATYVGGEPHPDGPCLLYPSFDRVQPLPYLVGKLRPGELVPLFSTLASLCGRLHALGLRGDPTVPQVLLRRDPLEVRWLRPPWRYLDHWSEIHPPGQDFLPTSQFRWHSPERVRGQPGGPASDFFALGSMLYEVHTGTPAFEGSSAIDTLRRILQAELPPLEGPVPARLAALLRDLWRLDPAQRLSDPAEFSIRLSAALPDRPR